MFGLIPSAGYCYCVAGIGLVSQLNLFQVSKNNKKRLPPLNEEEKAQGCQLGLDSHADIHCIGRHARIMEVFEGRACNVQPFHDSYQPLMNIKTANAAFAYDTSDGTTYILEVNLVKSDA